MLKLVPKDNHARVGEIIDELGPLQEKLKKSTYLRDIKRRDVLRQQLVELLNLRANQGASDAGELWAIEISPCEPRREITSMAQVMDLLGTETFLDVAKVPINKLEEHLSACDLEDVLESKRTGPRKFDTMEIFTDAKAA